MATAKIDHAAIAAEYARAVIALEVPAGGWVRKAAARHLADFSRVASADYPYRFDGETGARAARFISCLPHTKGRWAAKKELLRLEPWQSFLIVTLFGWLRKDNGKRRFRSAYLEIPRKNGKSILGAAIGLYMLLADKEFGAEVYSGATTEKQAWEVFMPAKLMLERTPKMIEYFGAEVCAKSLIVAKNGSKFEPVIGNPGDGPSPSCAIVDEYHEHATPALYDSMETGMGAREQPLLLVITTAGYNIAGPCHEKHDELMKVLDGVSQNDELFGCIFSIDSEDDWADPRSLIKANPNYGVSVDGDYLQSMQRQAMSNPVQQTRFKTKHLNVWCSVLTGWMNMQLWLLAGDAMLDESELLGSDCWIANDLASKSDLCASLRLYRRVSHGKPHFYFFARYWLPEEAIEEEGPNHAHYMKWVKQQLLTPTDGAYVDFDLITETLIEDVKRCNPKEVIFDPFNATQMMNDLASAGIKTCVEFHQTPANFAVPMDEFMSALKDGRVHHDANEITTWCMSNVVAAPAKKGLFWPTKQKNKGHQKIDGAVAAIMAFARSCANDVKAEPEYQAFSL